MDLTAKSYGHFRLDASAADSPAPADRPPVNRLPFGKHRGRLLTQVPANYLRWLTEQDWVHAPLKRACAGELHRRDGVTIQADADCQQQAAPPLRLLDPPIDPSLVRAIIDRGERAVLRDVDPSDDGAAAATHDAAQWLRRHSVPR